MQPGMKTPKITDPRVRTAPLTLTEVIGASPDEAKLLRKLLEARRLARKVNEQAADLDRRLTAKEHPDRIGALEARIAELERERR